MDIKMHSTTIKKVSSYIHIFHLSIPEVMYQTIIYNIMKSGETVTSVLLWHNVQFLCTLLYFIYSSTFFLNNVHSPVYWGCFSCDWPVMGLIPRNAWNDRRYAIHLTWPWNYVILNSKHPGNLGGAWLEKRGVPADHVTDWTGEQCSFTNSVLTTVAVTDGADLK